MNKLTVLFIISAIDVITAACSTMDSGKNVADTSVFIREEYIPAKEEYTPTEKIDQLDSIIKKAADEVIDRLPANIRVALLNNSQNSIEFVEYVIDEIEVLLVNSQNLVIVERKDIDIILAEQAFQLTGNVSDESIVSIGHLLGAESIIVCYLDGSGTLRRLRVKTLDVETGQIQSSDSYNIGNIDIYKYRRNIIETIEWQANDDGYIQYRTNDNAKCGFYYKSFQKVYINDEEIIGNKISGSFGSGYGLYFNYIDHNNFYRMQILPTGKYSVIKYANGELSGVIDWTDSPIINQGFDTENIIRIDYSNSIYDIYINNVKVNSFSNTLKYYYSAYYCIHINIESLEHFPNVAADFRLKTRIKLRTGRND
jgi:hypothetical protein